MKRLGKIIGILAIVAMATFLFVGFLNAFLAEASRAGQEMQIPSLSSPR